MGEGKRRLTTNQFGMETLSDRSAGALAQMDWDHLHFYVGNARQAAHFYVTAFGFALTAYAGPETGVRDRASYLLEQGDMRMVLTSPLGPDGPIADFVRRHGDGIADVALRVSDARAALAEARAGGANVVAEAAETRDEHGSIVSAAISTYGNTLHTFVERSNYRGPFMPGFVAHPTKLRAPSAVGLVRVDHVVGNVGWNEMDAWADYYRKVFGFTQLVSFDDHDISTEYTALRSIVMADEARRVKFPINEPAKGLKKSQIEEYLDFFGGAGVQHVAIATDDIVSTVRALRANGVELLDTPASYYEALGERVGEIGEDIDVLRELSILVDRDDLGYMLQIFTKPLQDRPTLFFELIQRKGSQSFGKGNFKALFVSIEEEQAKRGTL
jgi:4-hydroxyphenylpyruvate dioxygenase